MFKNTLKGQTTRETILDTALTLFRARGFDQTTMRDIAREAEMSLGAAYHYFESKEAIVLAYYDRIQAEHASLVAERLGATAGLADRIGLVMTSKLDLIADDARLLGALLRFAGDPDHPLSFFGPKTRRLRTDSIALFHQAVAGERFPPDIKPLIPVALWALHMGLLLYAVYDRSPGLARTRRLAKGTTDFVVGLFKLVRLPPFGSLRRRLAALVEQAGLGSTAPRTASGA